MSNKRFTMTRHISIPIPSLPSPQGPSHHDLPSSYSPTHSQPVMTTGRGGAGNMRPSTRIERASEQESNETMAAVQEHAAEIDGYLCPPHQQPEDQQVLQRVHTELLVQKSRDGRLRHHHCVGDGSEDGGDQGDGQGRRRSSLVGELRDMLNPVNAGRDRRGSVLERLKERIKSVGKGPGSSGGGAEEEEEVGRSRKRSMISASENEDGDGNASASSAQSTVESSNS